LETQGRKAERKKRERRGEERRGEERRGGGTQPQPGLGDIVP